MLSHEDNETLVRVGAGKPMGELFRRFWFPALLSSELPMPDCTPVRLRLLGEDLVAFRDSLGRVGIVDAYCPHRGALMFFGRNEECGLRCIYHAWKFDVTGKCVDLPSAPEGEGFKDKVSIKAYPAVDKGGLIWIYMGPKEQQPPLPGFEWLDLPDSHRYITKYQIHCNYLQALEGDFDPGHLYLHSTLDDNRTNKATRFTNIFRNSAQIVSIEEAPHGLTYVTKNADEKRQVVSVGHFILPFSGTAGLTGPNTYASNIRVPMDDEWTTWFRLRWSEQPIPEEELNEAKYGGYTHPEIIPGTFITKANKDNDYLIDRAMQRNYSVSGISAFPLQDLCVQENQWGPVADRTREHLQSTDRIIIQIRGRLLKLAYDLAAGTEPLEPHDPGAFRVRRERRVFAPDIPAEQMMRELKQKALSHRVLKAA